MLYVTRIRLNPPTSTNHVHITKLEWKNSTTGKTGISTTQEMITWIDGGNEARVSDGVKEVTVHVVRPSSGSPYLRTKADGRWTNNLLALPRF